MFLAGDCCFRRFAGVPELPIRGQKREPDIDVVEGIALDQSTQSELRAVRFARDTRYKKIRLWTQESLVAARRLYAAAGFKVVESKPHRSFGKDLVGEYWELDL